MAEAWTDLEIDLIVADYFAMLVEELTGRAFSKAERNRALQGLLTDPPRSRGSIEFKHQNISAVLLGLGQPWINGYKPAANFQNALVDGVLRWLDSHPDWLAPKVANSPSFLREVPSLWIGPPPSQRNEPPPVDPEFMAAIGRKYDVAERDARNRRLGKAGEELILYHERQALAHAGRDDLADKVRWTSEQDGDGFGYDIASFEPDGRERMIEVKTTNGWERTPFHITRNEMAVAETRRDDWHLVRVWNFVGVPSKRSEVLFVDYIAEHLNPKGRAAIVVPEGIIFQSQSAYCDLRRMLVGKYLAAVISLPAGVFNPYSGVKTSILILDRAVAKASDSIAFFRIENDGFGLGAQRRAVKGSQLPQVKFELGAWLDAVRGGGEAVLKSSLGFAVEKARIGEDGQYNLSGERYRETSRTEFAVPRVPIGDVCVINPRKSEIGDLPPETMVSFAPMAVLNEHRISFAADEAKPLGDVGASYTYFADGDVLLAKVTPCFENGKAGIARGLTNGIGFGSSEFYVIRPGEQVLAQWVYHCVMHPSFRTPAVANMTGTGGLQRVPRDFVERFEIPLPPLEAQREIVAEIEGYQKVIDGARAVLENYRPHIQVDPVWPVGAIKEIATTVTPPAKLQTSEYRESGQFPIIDQSQEFIAGWTDSADAVIDPADGMVVFGDHTCVIKFVDQPFVQGADGIKILKPIGDLSAAYLAYYLQAHPLPTDGYRRHFSLLKDHKVALPPLETQQSIVAEIEAEQALVEANRELIARFEKKIEAAIARVWGAAAEAAVA